MGIAVEEPVGVHTSRVHEHIKVGPVCVSAVSIFEI
jgi:hypothetical protein